MGASLPFRVRGEPRKVESWGSQPPPHHLEDLGNAASSLGGVLGGAPAAIRFSSILEAPDDFCV